MAAPASVSTIQQYAPGTIFQGRAAPSAAQRGYAMPSLHWPRTSIQENMWNSKSCPDGLPRQKNGVMASRQTPASANAREIGFLSKGSLAYFNFRRDAACRIPFRRGDGASAVSTGGVGCAQSNSIASENSRKINPAETIYEGCRGSLPSTSRTDHRGLGRHQRRGVDPVPGFCWDHFLLGSRVGTW